LEIANVRFVSVSVGNAF